MQFVRPLHMQVTDKRFQAIAALNLLSLFSFWVCCLRNEKQRAFLLCKTDLSAKAEIWPDLSSAASTSSYHISSCSNINRAVDTHVHDYR